MKLRLLLIIGLLGISSFLKAQTVMVNTNLLGWATTNMNVGVGLSIAPKWSLHLDAMYNPWIFGNNKKIQNLTVSPGVRYWTQETYIKHFIGVNAISSQYHMGWNRYRYEGNAYGLGVSYGYTKMLSARLNLEFEVGLGAVYADYTKYRCEKCGDKMDEEKGIRLTPNKAAVSLVYIF